MRVSRFAERNVYSSARNVLRFSTSSRKSLPFGVSSTLGILRKRRLRMMKRKAARPILPLPMCSCRSTREPREVFEFASQARSLAGGRFQRDPRLNFRNSRKHAVDRFDNSLEAGFFACAEMRARMQHQKRQFELIGAN